MRSSKLADVLELNAQYIALNRSDAAVSDNPVRFGHQLKPDWNKGCVRDLDSRPIGGDIGNGAAGAGTHIRNVSRSLMLSLGFAQRSSNIDIDQQNDTPMRDPLREITLHEMIFFLATTFNVNRSGMMS